MVNEEEEMLVGLCDGGKAGCREEVDDDALQTHVQVGVNEDWRVEADLVGEREEHFAARVGLVNENGDAGIALFDSDAEVEGRLRG